MIKEATVGKVAKNKNHDQKERMMSSSNTQWPKLPKFVHKLPNFPCKTESTSFDM